MSEFSRTGPQLPTEQRRAGQAEHERDLVDLASNQHRVHEAEHAGERSQRPWWKFWAKR